MICTNKKLAILWTERAEKPWRVPISVTSHTAGRFLQTACTPVFFQTHTSTASYQYTGMTEAKAYLLPPRNTRQNSNAVCSFTSSFLVIWNTDTQENSCTQMICWTQFGWKIAVNIKSTSSPYSSLSWRWGFEEVTFFERASMTSRSQWRKKSHLLSTKVSTKVTATMLAALIDSVRRPFYIAKATFGGPQNQCTQDMLNNNCPSWKLELHQRTEAQWNQSLQMYKPP